MTRAVRVALPVPLYRTFDYLAPAPGAAAVVGARVRVPFGRRQLIGVIVEVNVVSDLAPARLRPIAEYLDAQPVLPKPVRDLVAWTARYYHHPLGEVYAAALPGLLRRGCADQREPTPHWRLTEAGRALPAGEPARATRQRAILAALRPHPGGLAETDLRSCTPAPAAVLARLQTRGWIAPADVDPSGSGVTDPVVGPALHPQQAEALAAITAGEPGFAATLLDGVTGSGKTEVYLHLIERTLAAGRQVLVLVPEIGLTPQLVSRFAERLGARLAVLHSGLTAARRLAGWLAARDGEASLVLGTRSAIFTPLPRLGLIVVDEEHDPSYKQQDGLRYSARDLAVRRAQMADVPIVLGSATPALETLQNARAGRYRHLRLDRRAGGARPPAVQLLDVRSRPLEEGLSAPLLARLRSHLDAGGQALLFLNRRGFAPALVCHDCGWIAPCARCEASMTLHRGGRSLRCHHCGAARPAPRTCDACGGERVIAVGEGTERVTAALRSALPGVAVARFDRDTTAAKGSLETLLAQVRSGALRVLVGTQMLAKGHDFPNLSFVGVINADHGLFSADFRAFERMAQLVTQVAGRAGRGQRPGEVLLQTHHPQHPLLGTLVRHGYAAFAQAALIEREQAAMPPFGFLALLEAEAPRERPPFAFLEAVIQCAGQLGGHDVAFWGPAPAPLERRAGRHRAHLLLHAANRRRLHRLLARLAPRLADLPAAGRVRWALDVDPHDLA